MKGWHFVEVDGDGLWRTVYGHLPVKVGETLVHQGNVRPRYQGLHASHEIVDALLGYAYGPVFCRVEVQGGIVEDGDVFAGKCRTCLWGLDATPTMRKATREIALGVARHWDAPDSVVKYLSVGPEGDPSGAMRLKALRGIDAYFAKHDDAISAYLRKHRTAAGYESGNAAAAAKIVLEENWRGFKPPFRAELNEWRDVRSAAVLANRNYEVQGAMISKYREDLVKALLDEACSRGFDVTEEVK